MSRATTKRIQRRVKAERNGARLADRNIVNEDFLIGALVLALEESIEFGVLRCLLAIRNRNRVGLGEFSLR